MIIHTAHLVCKPEHVDAFSVRLRRHAQTCLALERGCKRFDVHQGTDNATLFFLHEIYQDQAAMEEHRASSHFLEFRRDVADWVVERMWWFWSKVEPVSE